MPDDLVTLSTIMITLTDFGRQASVRGRCYRSGQGSQNTATNHSRLPGGTSGYLASLPQSAKTSA